MNYPTSYSVAIIGSGYMAKEHIAAVNSLPQARVTGIYSRNHENASRLATEMEIPFVGRSIDELYQLTKADLVIVAITETAVFELIDTLFNYPWCLLMEKPVGLHLQEAQAIHEKALAKQANVLVALNRRFYGATQSVKQDLQDYQGKKLIQVQDVESFEIAREYNYPPEVTRNLMFANSIHIIDYFNIFARGNVEKVNVVQKWNSETCFPVIAHIQYDSGDEGIYQGIWHGPGPWSVSIATEERYYEMRPLESAHYRTKTERTPVIYPPSQEDQQYKPGLKKQALHALLHVQQQPNQSVTLAESLKTMQLIHQIYS